MLAKSMQKHAGRAKEKILQNLGKVDRTADDIFDDHLNNFNRQQANATRLQKEFSNYIRCIRAVQVASKSLMDAVGEIYEPQWTGYDALQAQSAASESLWQDFSHKLADQVLIPLNTYTGQFPEMKKKIEKRNRKLIDYDGQRHSFQSLQASANKRKDDVKGREQLEDARRTYEILNTELHDELPALYDSRILFLVTNLQTLFATENVFHSETAKIYSELEAIVDKLATDSQRGSNTLRKQTTNAIKSSSPVLASPLKQLNASNMNMNNSNYQNQITTNGSSNANSPTTTSSSSQQESRLDSVSPTPESSPDNHRAATPTTPTPVSPARAKSLTSNPTNAGATSSRTASTDQLSIINDVIGKEEQENCINANTINNNDNDHNADNNITTTTTSNNMNDVKTTITTATTKEKTPKGTKEITEIVTEKLNGNAANGNLEKIEKLSTEEINATAVVSNTEANNGNIVDNKKSLGETETNSRNVKSRKLESKNPFEDDERIYEVPDDATTADLPPGVLYRVKATYGYVKEDVDELSFEIGDIIRVIEYDDPEDQEEGWLMGQKEGTNEKGLFPANFTKPI